VRIAVAVLVEVVPVVVQRLLCLLEQSNDVAGCRFCGGARVGRRGGVAVAGDGVLGASVSGLAAKLLFEVAVVAVVVCRGGLAGSEKEAPGKARV
jgi:hypothetical protein